MSTYYAPGPLMCPGSWQPQSHLPRGKNAVGRKGLNNETGIQESRQTLETSQSKIPAMEPSGVREVGDNFWLGWPGVAFWRRGTLKGLFLSPSVTMTVTTSWAPVLRFMFHIPLYSPQRSKVSFVLQMGRGNSESKGTCPRSHSWRDWLSSDLSLCVFHYAMLPRQCQHKVSINADLFIFHSSSPFAMINRTSTYQLDGIMSFPHGQRGRIHPLKQTTLPRTRKKKLPLED